MSKPVVIAALAAAAALLLLARDDEEPDLIDQAQALWGDRSAKERPSA